MDRRKYYRNKIEVMIDYLDGSEIEVGYTKDISLGGMFIETTKTSELGNMVFLDFYLPGIRKKFKLKGKVKWTSDNADAAHNIRLGMGIEFVKLDDNNKSDLNIGIKNIRRNNESK